ncbi:hypothetical protein MPSEU_000760800 [Mayamaea pseudoterrestris]|nr:hypothetical protein MPSEU_000760800 [Mayamaea pseudoterrestris]
MSTTPATDNNNQDATDASSAMKDETSIKWFPLESNPQLLNDYLGKLGLNVAQVSLHDVFSTEDWALGMVPRPVYAVVFLYPLTNKLKSRNDHAVSTSSDSHMIYIPQRIGNACGTMALLHATLNATRPYIMANSWLKQFDKQMQSAASNLQRAQVLEADETLAELHEQATRSAQSATQRQDLSDYENLETHFVTFVCDNQRLMELDGRVSVGGPVDCRMACSPEKLLETACEYIRTKIMPLDPTEMRFTILALAETNDE